MPSIIDSLESLAYPLWILLTSSPPWASNLVSLTYLCQFLSFRLRGYPDPWPFLDSLHWIQHSHHGIRALRMCAWRSQWRKTVSFTHETTSCFAAWHHHSLTRTLETESSSLTWQMQTTWYEDLSVQRVQSCTHLKKSSLFAVSRSPAPHSVNPLCWLKLNPSSTISSKATSDI